MTLKQRFVIRDRLGINQFNDKLFNPRWCSKHENKEQFETSIKFEFKNKNDAHKFNVFTVPTNEGLELKTTKTEGKGIGLDRHDTNFF